MSAVHPITVNFWRALRERRSIRRYTPQAVPHNVLERLLDAAVCAPNAHNRQPWRFAVTTDRQRQERLAAAMAEHWLATQAADGTDPVAAERRAQISRSRIGGAGAVVAGCLTMVDMDQCPDPARQGLEWQMAAQSTALALGNLLLAAQAEGLGACWMCAPLFTPDIVRREMDLPPDWEPQALITLGYPAETRTSTRKPLDEVVLWR